MMQPTFLPWAGFLALIDTCDTFVLLDDFQFQRHSFHHRNRLFVSGDQPGWVIVPVEHAKSDSFPQINQVRPVLQPRFRKKFLRLVQQNYGKTPYYDLVMPPVASILERDWGSLADLNISLIECLAALLDISATFQRSSTLGVQGKRSERVAELLRRLSASTYLASAGSEEYMRADEVFPLAGVDTYFQQYVPAQYVQRQARVFVPYLSVLDMLLQIGPDQGRDRVREGDRGFIDWHRGSVLAK